MKLALGLGEGPFKGNMGLIKGNFGASKDIWGS